METQTLETPVTHVKVMPNGPVIIEGNVVITNSDGSIITKEGKAAFCRCGQSAKKPFCDGTHKRCEWDENA